jgi:FdhD protein
MAIDLTQMQHPLGLRRLGYASPLLEVSARRWEGGRGQESTEQVAEETPVAIVYNGIPHVVMMATPSDLEDFALGFSITEELIRTPADLQSLQVVRYGQGIEIQAMVSPDCEATIASRNRRLTGRTGCGICGMDSIEGVLKQLHPVTSSATVTTGAVENACRTLVGHQTLNSAAGAVHAAGWASCEGEIQLAREDVGRHNALDKLIGAMLGRGVKPESGFLVVTSRASFEMVQKATVFGTSLLVAISGPTGLAVRIAEHAGLTLVGFARAARLTVYTHGERLTS